MQTQGTAPRKLRTANCTHIDMDRIYGRDLRCPQCNRPARVGFLYQCRQDWNPIWKNPVPENVLPRDTSQMSLREELQMAGLSESVIKTAEQGLYTDEQLEKLKSQKRKVMMLLLGQPRQPDPALIDGTEVSTAPRPCDFTACHTCRPYFKDRVFATIDSVYENLHAPAFRSRDSYLPTKDARILRHVGLTENPPLPEGDAISLSTRATVATSDTGRPSQDSNATFRTTQSDLSVLRRMRNPRRRFYKLSNRSSGSIRRNIANARNLLPAFSRRGLRSAIQGIFKPTKDVNVKPTESSITLPLPRTGTARNPTAGESGEKVLEYDMGVLRRVRRQKERVERQVGTSKGGFEMGPRVRAIIPNGVPVTNLLPDITGVRGKGVIPNGVVPNGVVPNGVASNGVVPNGVVPKGVLPERVLHNGGPSSAPVSQVLSNYGTTCLPNGVVPSGTASLLLASQVVPNNIQTDNDEEMDTDSSDSLYSPPSEGSVEGSEVEVNGGVALTEEAVETHTPDILESETIEDTYTEMVLDTGGIMAQV